MSIVFYYKGECAAFARSDSPLVGSASIDDDVINLEFGSHGPIVESALKITVVRKDGHFERNLLLVA